MVHKASGRAELLAVDHVDGVVVEEEVEVEEIAVGVFGGGEISADGSGLQGDYFAEVDVDELAGADEIRRAEACLLVSDIGISGSSSGGGMMTYRIHGSLCERSQSAPSDLSARRYSNTCPYNHTWHCTRRSSRYALGTPGSRQACWDHPEPPGTVRASHPYPPPPRDTCTASDHTQTYTHSPR